MKRHLALAGLAKPRPALQDSCRRCGNPVHFVLQPNKLRFSRWFSMLSGAGESFFKARNISSLDVSFKRNLNCPSPSYHR